MDNSVFQALTGGLLIGLSASLLILFSGRVAGISGIFHALLFEKSERLWRFNFIAGLILGAALCHWLTGKPVPELAYDNLPLAAIAGFLVGYGTSLGSGCTSGHGICGLARLSPRSLVATLCFMATGIITVALVGMVTGGLQ